MVPERYGCASARRQHPHSPVGQRVRRADQACMPPSSARRPRRWHTNRASACKAAGERSGASTSGSVTMEPTGGMGRSVAAQGIAKAWPSSPHTRTQGAPPRQKTCVTRPTCPQYTLSSAITVSRTPRNAPYGAECCGAKRYHVGSRTPWTACAVERRHSQQSGARRATARAAGRAGVGRRRWRGPPGS
jgi:hypothetical protein